MVFPTTYKKQTPFKLGTETVNTFFILLPNHSNGSFSEKTYFYRRERFWRYNETAKTMDPGYPLHMERWRGVPENLDAATTWKDGQY